MKLVRRSLDAEQLAVEEALFHVANGYIGVRGNLEEGAPEGAPSIRGCYINGYYDEVPIHYPEKHHGYPETAQRMVNLPDVQTTRIWLDSATFSPFAVQMEDYERVLDTHQGVAIRRMRGVGPGGLPARLTITRMASFTRPELFLTVFDIEYAGEVELESIVDCRVLNFTDPTDPRVAGASEQHLFLDAVGREGEDTAWARCHTGRAGLGMAVCQVHKLSCPGSVRTVTTEAGFASRAQVAPENEGHKDGTGQEKSRLDSARKDGVRRVRVEKYTLFCDERRVADPLAHVLASAGACARAGADALLSEQKEYLDVFWDAAQIHIEGDPSLEEGMQYNQYMLLQSAGHDGVGNVAAKGLSGEGYEGHYFWDSEIYILPVFLYTRPEVARGMLAFRHATLGAARAHAREMGHARGALYPWRTIAGSECSPYFPSGSAQYHISGDVAHSFLKYFYATGDLGFMAAKGAEVLVETARLWLDVGNYDDEGRFCIQEVTGPDEYTCLVDNNYYTNKCAQQNLRAAVEIYRLLEAAGLQEGVRSRTALCEEELEAFLRAADAMCLPYDEKLGIRPQDDSFLHKPRWDFAATPREHYPLLLHYHPLYIYRHQVCKQADTVLAHFLFEDGEDEEVMRRSYEYYEEVTTHDSSLSTCIFSVMASRLGFSQKAYDYFLRTVRTDLDNMHKNTKDGIHTANMGGAWLAVVCGFAGLRVRPEGAHLRFTLPARWRGYHFSLWCRGSLLRFEVRREKVVVTLAKGPPVDIYVDGKPVRVAERIELEGVVHA